MTVKNSPKSSEQMIEIFSGWPTHSRRMSRGATTPRTTKISMPIRLATAAQATSSSATMAQLNGDENCANSFGASHGIATMHNDEQHVENTNDENDHSRTRAIGVLRRAPPNPNGH